MVYEVWKRIDQAPKESRIRFVLERVGRIRTGETGNEQVRAYRVEGALVYGQQVEAIKSTLRLSIW